MTTLSEPLLRTQTSSYELDGTELATAKQCRRRRSSNPPAKSSDCTLADFGLVKSEQVDGPIPRFAGEISCLPESHEASNALPAVLAHPALQAALGKAVVFRNPTQLG